jgi:hypothetical protein
MFRNLSLELFVVIAEGGIKTAAEEAIDKAEEDQCTQPTVRHLYS